MRTILKKKKVTEKLSAKKVLIGGVMFVTVIASAFGVSIILDGYASSTPQFSQVINAGTLATDVRDASRATVASPAVTMSSKAAPSCETSNF